MRANKSEGFEDKKFAEDVLDALRRAAGDKLKKAEVELTIYSRPGDEHYEISVIYRDPDKTPFNVHAEVKSLLDFDQLLAEGCAHDYSLGTVHDHSLVKQWARVECHCCHGVIDIPQEDIIRHILGTNANKLKYDHWPKAEQSEK